MTGSDDHQISKADIETVLAEFDAKGEMLSALCTRTKSLIEASLQDARIQYQPLQVRVKTKTKLKEKYLNLTKNYERLDDITDLAGLRVITYYEDDVDRAAVVIKREFDIDWQNSIDKRDTEPDRFGYNALNYVCRHLEKRTSDVEYKRFAGVRFEIQITSILRHAWSEMEHEWYDLKEAYPENIKRRFYRLAALLEVAESDFLDIRKSRTQYERSVAVRVEAKVPDLPVDTVSLRSFIEREPIVAEIDKALLLAVGRVSSGKISDKVVELWSKAANLVGLTKLEDIRIQLTKHRAAIPEFASRCRREFWPTQDLKRPIDEGISIFQLSVLLASLRGAEALTEFYNAYGFTFDWNIERQVDIAKEVVEQFPN